MAYNERKKELEQLKGLLKKDSASLACILGRRRIGKSALITEFSKSMSNFFEVQGLGPDEEHKNAQNQFDHFAHELADSYRG